MFKNLYKEPTHTIKELQDARRRALLKEQKLKRLEVHDAQRDIEVFRSKPKRKGPRTFKETYRSDLSLQLSEWLREQPKELSDWYLVPCPRGQRCLVVASGERTEVYSKAGRRCFRCRTLLPGDGVARKTTTILDCIYIREQDSFYVLDLLVFANQEMINCEAQFRIFWLRSKFEDHEELTKRTRFNEKPFYLLDWYDFEYTDRIAVATQRYPIWANNKPELDGFLFYHKEASYTCGVTPLVCWLFPFMMPDVLGMTVSAEYERPDFYHDPLEFMDQFDISLALQKQQRRRHFGCKDVDIDRKAEDEYGQSEALEMVLATERAIEMDEEEDSDELATP